MRKARIGRGSSGPEAGRLVGLWQTFLVVTVTAVSKCLPDRNPLQGSLPQPTAFVDSKPLRCQFSLQYVRKGVGRGRGAGGGGTVQKGVFV